MGVKLKVCNKCGEKKPLTDFHFDKTKADGRRTRCKVCRLASDRKNEKVRNSPYVPQTDSDLSKAKQMALKTLVENHPREFRQLVSTFYQQIGAPKRWHSVA